MEALAPMQAATRNLIDTIEVFRPCEEGLIRSCLNDAAFAKGEGLVGEAWEEGLPCFGHDPDGRSYVAIPAIEGDRCRGVLQLSGYAGEDGRGAFELWRPNERGELGLAENWYANLDRLAQISHHIKFPRRAGLPGRVWEDRFPRALGGLTESKNFVRVATARSERLTSAIGIPFMNKPPALDGVFLALNSELTPLSRAMEVWARDTDGGRLKIVSADYGPYRALAEASRTATLSTGQGITGHVYRDRAPWSTNDLLGVEFPRGEFFAEFGFEQGVGFPVFIGSDLVASVNLYL